MNVQQILAAIFLASVAFLPAFAEEATTKIPPALEAAIEESHEALRKILNGDPSGYGALFADRDDITLGNPFGAFGKGREAVLKALDNASTKYHDGSVLAVDRIAVYGNDTFVCLVEVEHDRAKLRAGGDFAEFAARVTSVYENVGERWRLVHRHADPITTPRPAESMLGQPATVQGLPPTAGLASPLVHTVSPPPAREVPTKYGDMPTDYQEAIQSFFLKRLRYPDSVQYQVITKPEQGYTTAVTGTFLMREKREYGWKVNVTINAKNSHDSYAGFKIYTFLFRGEKIVDVRLPLPKGEMIEPTPE
ncbi:MAG: nuclear transport factor 2 family protein [Acidobacteriota bacterium]|nr:nuclear transport factor 2 family protein [Acidobacteriota bacterium]